jgi:DUF917 family protein
MIILDTPQKMEDFVRGCCFYATGGGGDPLFGQKMLLDALHADKKIEIIDADTFTDDTWTVCPYLMGPAPGPETEETRLAKLELGLKNETISNMPSEAVKLLLEDAQIKLGAIIPLELGAAATASALATAAWLGVPTIDGDYAGRALPEVIQILPAIEGMNLLPIASSDRYGNQVIIKKSTGDKMTERLGKILATASYGLVGQATLLQPLAKLKSMMLFGTLSKALAVGEALRKARETNDTSLQAVLDLTGADVIYSGKITKFEASVASGYYVGNIYIDKLRLWFKNEIILSWMDGKPYLSCPDLITLVNKNTLEPMIIGNLSVGMELFVLAIKAPEQFYTPQALKVLGPEHFGVDFS